MTTKLDRRFATDPMERSRAGSRRREDHPSHPNDPATYEPMDAEMTDDDDMDDAERAAEADADLLGCYPDWQR